MKSKFITLIRHGETYNDLIRGLVSVDDFNYAREVESKLTEKGRYQSLLLQKYMDKNKEYLNYDLVVASPMLRALETSEIVFKNYEAKKEIWTNIYESRGPYHLDSVYPGLKRSEITKMFPEYAVPLYINENGWYVKRKIESVPEVFQRAREFLRQIINYNRFQRIAVVSHGKFLSYVVTIIIKEYLMKYLSANCSFFPSNTGIINVNLMGTKFVFQDIDILPHLEDLPNTYLPLTL